MVKPPKEWDNKHNNCAYLNETHKLARYMKGMLLFLKRSRIAYAISESRTPYLSHQRSFWENAKIRNDRDPTVIVSRVLGQEITISEQTVRECLHFGDGAEDPLMLPDLLVRGCLLRIKYDEDVSVKTLNKSNLSPAYKYLAHVIIHCLGPRRGGYDELSMQQLSAMVALILNRPFNFSGMIFNHMSEMIGKERGYFLMYPRFLQIIFDCLLENLPRDEKDIMKLEHQSDQTVSKCKGYRMRERAPPGKRMIGHIARTDYMPPPNDQWRHDNSDSEVEDIALVAGPPNEHGGAAAAVTQAEGLTTSAPAVSQPPKPDHDISFSDVFSTEDVILEYNTTVQTSLVSSPTVKDLSKGIATEESQQEGGSVSEHEPDFHGAEMARLRQGQSSSAAAGGDATDPVFNPASETVTAASPAKGGRKKRSSVKEGAKLSKQLKKMSTVVKRQRFNLVFGSSHVQTTATTATTTSTTSTTTTPVPSTFSMPTLHVPMPRARASAAISVATSFTSATTSAFQPFQSSQSVDETFRNLVECFSIPQSQQTAGTSASSSSSDSQFAALQCQINNVLSLVQAQAVENLSNRRLIEAMVEREKTFMLMLKMAKDETNSLKSEVTQLRLTNSQYETRMTLYESKNKELQEQLNKLKEDLPQIRGNREEGDESEKDEEEEDDGNDGGDQGGSGSGQGGSGAGSSSAAPRGSVSHMYRRRLKVRR